MCGFKLFTKFNVLYVSILSISCAPHPQDFIMTCTVHQTIKATELFQYLDIIHRII